jgi:hypothetical protein
MERNPWLVGAGLLSAAAALLHLAIIVGGPDWYRFFGAGEGMARMAEQGSARPTLITLGIAAVLAIWAAYAFAGAGLLPRLPLLRTALVAITAVYLLRGLVILPLLAFRPDKAGAFACGARRSCWATASSMPSGPCGPGRRCRRGGHDAALPPPLPGDRRA